MSFKFLREDEERGGIVEVEPTPTYIDPVSKIRVSQPENLIDTDFEYGLQETKWETLERVNNIPTFFARPGDRPIPVDRVTATVGSSRIAVETTRPHGLVVGSPIIAVGVDVFEAEGAFVVDDVPSTTTFSYVCKDVIFRAGLSAGAELDVTKEETVIIIGRLYQGTQAKLDALDAIVTDGKEPSRLTVSTPTAHGFSEGTKFILSNSVGGKTYRFDASESVAEDFIEKETGESRVYESPSSIDLADWNGKHSVLFSGNDVDWTRNYITAPNHPFSTGDAVMYLPPIDTEAMSGTNSDALVTDRRISGITSYNALYYVWVMDENRFQLTTTEILPNTTTSPSIVSFSDHGKTDTGLHQIAKCYRVESVRTDGVITLRRPLVETEEVDGSECYVFSTSSGINPSNATRSFANYNAQDQLAQRWRRFYVKQDTSAATTSLPTSPEPGYLRVVGSNINVFSNTWSIVPEDDPSMVRGPVVGPKQRVVQNSLDNFETGDWVRVYRRKGEGFPGSVGEGTNYWIRKVDSTTFTLHTTREGAINNTNLRTVSNQGGTGFEAIIEKNNRFVKLYLDEQLNNQFNPSNTSISGTTWIVLARGNPNFATLDGGTSGGEQNFTDINNGEVVEVISESRDDEAIDWTTFRPQSSFTDVTLYPGVYTRLSDARITLATGTMSVMVTNGQPLHYSVRPHFWRANNRSIDRSNNRWNTGDSFNTWVRGVKTGDKVFWRQNPSNVYSYYRLIEPSNNDWYLRSGYGDVRNGDAIRLVNAGDFATPPITVPQVEEGQIYYTRRISSSGGRVGLYLTRQDALSNTNKIQVLGRGGYGSYQWEQALPEISIPSGVTPECEEDEFFIRILNNGSFELYKTRADAENGVTANRVNLIPDNRETGGFTYFEQVLDGTEGYYWRTNSSVEFDQDGLSVDTSTNTFTMPEPHGFHTGEEVRYVTETPVGGMSQGLIRWVRVTSPTSFTLHTSRDNAVNNAGIVVLSGNPEGKAKFTRTYGDTIHFESQLLDTTNNTLTLPYEHDFQTGDNVFYRTLSGSISGLSNQAQYFLRRIDSTTIAFYDSKPDAINDTGRRNLTGGSLGTNRYGSLQKVEQLPQNRVYYKRRIDNSRFFLYHTAQEAISNWNRIFFVDQPLETRPWPSRDSGKAVQLSGQVVFSAAAPWTRVNSVNNTSIDRWNTNNNSLFKTGQAVRLVRMFNESMNISVSEGDVYYIRRDGSSRIYLHRTYSGAMRNLSSDRVPIRTTGGAFHIEGLPLPVGLSQGRGFVVEKVGSNRVRFLESATSGRVIRIAPTANTRFGGILLKSREPNAQANTVFVPGHGLTEGTPLVYNSGPNPIISTSPQIDNNDTIFVATPTENRFRVSQTSGRDDKVIEMTGLSADTTAFFFQDPDLGLTRAFTQNNSTTVNTSTNVIRTQVPHGFSTGDPVVYHSSAPAISTKITQLDLGRRYFVRRISNTDVALYLTEQDAIADTNRINLANRGSGTGFLSRNNFAVGDAVTVSSTALISGIQSGSLYYVAPITPERFALFYTLEEAQDYQINSPGEPPSDLRAPILSYSSGTTVRFIRNDYINISDIGVGTQELTNVAQNAVDGIYSLDVKIGGDTSTSFSLSPTDAVLSPRLFSLNPYKSFSSQYNAFLFENHKLYTGAEIVYNLSTVLEFEQDALSVDEEDNLFFIINHGLTTGQKVTYVLREGGSEIFGLQENEVYFVRAIDSMSFALYESASDADNDINRINISVSFFDGEDGEDGESTDPSLPAVTTFNVTNDGFGAYVINGESNPALTLERGVTYTFNINATGHPFWITNAPGAYDSGNVFNDGVTNNGTDDGVITFAVPAGAPDDLYYVCQFHSAMAGSFNIVDGPESVEVTIDTSFDGEFDGEDGGSDFGPAAFVAESLITPPTNLTNDSSYYVIRVSKDWFQIADSKEAALLGTAIDVGGDLADEGSLGSDDNHSFTTFNIGAEVLGPGTVSTTLDSATLSGAGGTNFLNLFKNGDIFKVFVTQPTEEKAISQTASATNRQISFTQNTTNVNTSTNIIRTPAHSYLTGDYVRYNAAAPAGGLTDGQFYYVRLTQDRTDNATDFTLHNTKSDAFNNENIVNLTNSSSGPATFTQVNQFFEEDHGLVDGQTVIYNSETPMAGLVEGQAYYAGVVNTIREVNITGVNTSTNVFTSAIHNFVTGDEVAFESNDAPEGLTPGQNYYVRVLTTTTFTLHELREDAVGANNAVEVTTAGSGVRMLTQFTRSNTFRLYESYQEAIASEGSRDDNEVELFTGSGDANLSAVFTGSVFESRVLGVRSESGIVLEDSIPEIAQDGRTPIGTQSGFQYALVTSLFVKADGFALHRPFDGGVELTPSINPDASLVRQTRKYFRYQSGKGIQVSYGINFNAPKAIDVYTADQTTGIATIKTRFPNRVTEGLSIRVFDSGDAQVGGARGFIQSETNVNTNQIFVSGQQQPLVTGQKVIYTSESPITPLVNNGEYWVEKDLDSGGYFLHESLDSALSGSDRIDITEADEGSFGELTPQNAWNGIFEVEEVVDDITFTVQLDSIPASSFAEGFSQFVPNGWSGSLLRCGIFDDQNGLFFEYDGQNLNAVRRSSVEQIAGTASVAFNSNEVVGQNTLFRSQLSVNDSIVIRGQSYKVVAISSNTTLSVQPAYRGTSKSNIVITKTIDTKTPQSEWNLDKADGEGPSGFELDLTKMQMAYIDYSWYGAGKARFGFKAKTGEVLYFHEYVHNNLFTEAYMRSGNLPGRYEVKNLANPTYSPTIAHWGTSIIMDGRFDDDDSYLFTASGETISFTNTAEQQSFSGRITQVTRIGTTVIDGERVDVFFINAQNFTDVRNIRSGTEVNGAGLQPGTKTLLQPQQISGGRARVYIDRAPTATAGSDSSYTYGPEADDIPESFPLVSVRLGPSVDNSLVGAVGAREIINRMQLELKDIGVLTTHDIEVKMILNGNTDNLQFDNIGSPSLSQIIRHQKGDTITGGVEVFSFRVNGSSTETASIASSTVIDLDDIVELGNSIQGGDGIFPDGPDLLTIAASVVDTALITASTPLRASARVSWSEAQS